MIARIGLCIACSVLPAGALAQQAPPQLPITLPERPTAIEAAVSDLSDCVTYKLRALPRSIEPQTGAARIIQRCADELARVDTQAVRVINASSLSEERKAVALQELRARLALAETRVAERIRRRQTDHAMR